MSPPLPQNYHSLKQALPDWLEGLNFTHSVTLTFNQMGNYRPDHILEYARDKLKFFHSQIDRKLLGSRWQRKPFDERTFFIAFPEKIATNMHYHLLVRVPEPHKDRFEILGKTIWPKIVRSGTYDCKAIYNCNGIISYVIKEQFKHVNFDHILFSTELLNI